MQSTAVSAPGKVFLAGGYLVLDRKYTALTFGLNARIHVHATSDSSATEDVVVRSPQFQDAVWAFKIGEQYGLTEVNGKVNPFVETAVAYALAYVAVASPAKPTGLILTIIADDDYYSDAGTKEEGSRFSSFNIPVEKVHKTGLGSSAALVTSLVAATLLQVASPTLKDGLKSGQASAIRTLHNLAQAAHCAAQGKVGSGFDIASAVYGSCRYRRFSVNILEDVKRPGEVGFSESLRACVTEGSGMMPWDHEVNEDVAVPLGLRLVMCDVDCGSETPGMVRDVLKWRSQNQEAADALWTRLQTQNDALADELVALRKDPKRPYDHTRTCLRSIRESIRSMSKAANVPIEPVEQTKLIDICSVVSGVIGGVVPGAGGYDAVALLIEDKPKVLDDLKAMLSTYRFAQPGSSGHGKVQLLGVKGEFEGLRIEDPNSYVKWASL